jgi:hypothetical protein
MCLLTRGHVSTTAHFSVHHHMSPSLHESSHIFSPELTCLLTTTPFLSIRTFVFVHNNALACSLTCLFITTHFSVHYSLPVCSPQMVWLFTIAELSLEHYACFCSTVLVCSPQFTSRARACVCVCVFKYLYWCTACSITSNTTCSCCTSNTWVTQYMSSLNTILWSSIVCFPCRSSCLIK